MLSVVVLCTLNRVIIMLSVSMLGVSMLSVSMLNVSMLNVSMLNVVFLSVVAPLLQLYNFSKLYVYKARQ